MTRQQIVFHRSPMERRQFLLDSDERSSRGGHRLAEVAGGTTAECAAVVCCFPCTVVNILVLAVYKVPAGLYRKVLKKKRRRRILKSGGGDVHRTGHRFSVDRTDFSIRPVERLDRFSVDRTEFLVHPVERLVVKSMAVDEEFMELENEMWETFYGTGFWRSLSQRVD
ncbi:hypothetical protein SSX86_002628 [Deinandra increscens subsp. villosa]|uniref:Uncharacterized protein n=1 Tax=Deinandra increscens subsp. villosa TaxID=3103831 RepID=A0AAP0HB91_9ASTR